MVDIGGLRWEIVRRRVGWFWSIWLHRMFMCTWVVYVLLSHYSLFIIYKLSTSPPLLPCFSISSSIHRVHAHAQWFAASSSSFSLLVRSHFPFRLNSIMKCISWTPPLFSPSYCYAMRCTPSHIPHTLIHDSFKLCAVPPYLCIYAEQLYACNCVAIHVPHYSGFHGPNLLVVAV
jgi:hypothetical protein